MQEQQVSRILAATVVAVASGLAWAEEPVPRKTWSFDHKTQWAGWQPGGTIREVHFGADAVSFRAEGSDPLITGPEFKLAASNMQWVEVELECDAPGAGELFYTNKASGQYGGFEPRWRVDLDVPRAGRQTVIAWPFWAKLGQITRLRFDPPSDSRCKLYAIRVMEASPDSGPPEWDFNKGPGSWRPMHAAEFEPIKGELRVKAVKPQALIFSPVAPFNASERSALKLEASCPDEHVLGLYWTTKEEPGLFGQPIEMPQKQTRPQEDAGVAPGGLFLLEIDLRTFPQWQGTVTGLAIGFGTKDGEVLTLKSLEIGDNDPSKPSLRARWIGFTKPINRAGQPALLAITLEHAAGPAFPGGEMRLDCSGLDVNGMRQNVPAIPVGGQWTFKATVKPERGASARVFVNDQRFIGRLRVDPPVSATRPADYDVLVPRPVKTKYQIGAYYFPGWSADQLNRWEKQKDFPEREPVLGWYAEGRPEVADWHIKWAVENGLTFFVYDWYWRDGREELGAGLNEGFLKARYRGLMKFALMWANHPPFDVGSRERLLQVTDYWLERYFRQPNYLTVDGKPYVSFFNPTEVIRDLGGPEKCKEALETARERVRAAGLAGLHIGACGGAPGMVKAAGFDSLTGYNYRRTGATTLQSPYRQYLLGHEALWEGFQKSGITYIPLLTVGWDSRPWAGPRAEARFARRTQDFEEALGRLKAFLDAHGEKMAILEAWNEWGEGSYIEPNAEFGFGDLEAIRKVFAEPGDWPVNVAPGDVGLEGKYDLRKQRAGK